MRGLVIHLSGNWLQKFHPLILYTSCSKAGNCSSAKHQYCLCWSHRLHACFSAQLPHKDWSCFPEKTPHLHQAVMYMPPPKFTRRFYVREEQQWPIACFLSQPPGAEACVLPQAEEPAGMLWLPRIRDRVSRTTWCYSKAKAFSVPVPVHRCN